MKTAIVSGTSSGIGAAVAQAFLLRGYRVLGLSRRGNPDLATDPSYLDRRVDLRDPEAVRDALRDAEDGVNAVVVNAGVAPAEQPLATVAWSTLADTYESNVRTALNLTQHALPLLRANGGGSLTFVGSSQASGYAPQRLSYAAAKAALTTLMRSSASGFAADGIVANEVRPGLVATPMTLPAGTSTRPEILRLLNDGYRSEWLKPPELVAEWIVSIAEFPANGPTGQIFNYSRNPTTE
ncbi:SDR family oxidoreductase [Micromonospora lupini]|uniref:SDR family oxidoreductase n=1 Tax=Micromonospora lupini TaxID=285679 RepID=UPI0033E21F6F